MSKPLDVAVNMLWCRPGRVGGSEQYLVRQLLGLAAIVTEYEPKLFVLPGFREAHRDLEATCQVEVAPISGNNRARRIVCEHSWLARRARNAALVHHGGGTVPSGGSGPTVLTIHDLQYLTYPQYFSRLKRGYLNWAMPRSANRADVIAVPTEFVRRTVIEAYARAPDTVVVVPHGLDSSLGADATNEESLRTKFGLGAGPILVFPAVSHPHKGHLFLLDLMARYWTEPDLRLVFTGTRGAAHDTVMGAIERLGLRERVRHLGRVSDGDRDGLIKMAAALVFPSEYEGFGAPLIESMALGTPVICSDRACLGEVAGSAALVLPLELEAWSIALEQLLPRRAEMVAAGLERSTHFTAAVSAQALVAAYDLALA